MIIIPTHSCKVEILLNIIITINNNNINFKFHFICQYIFKQSNTVAVQYSVEHESCYSLQLMPHHYIKCSMRVNYKDGMLDHYNNIIVHS